MSLQCRNRPIFKLFTFSCTLKKTFFLSVNLCVLLSTWRRWRIQVERILHSGKISLEQHNWCSPTTVYRSLLPSRPGHLTFNTQYSIDSFGTRSSIFVTRYQNVVSASKSTSESKVSLLDIYFANWILSNNCCHSAHYYKI